MENTGNKQSFPEHSARFHFIFVEKVDLVAEMFHEVPGQVWCLCVALLSCNCPVQPLVILHETSIV